jgi:hypothetical protein
VDDGLAKTAAVTKVPICEGTGVRTARRRSVSAAAAHRLQQRRQALDPADGCAYTDADDAN